MSWPRFGVDAVKVSSDALLVEKVYDVVGLYLDPPESAVVLCVHEKSQQAPARTSPVLPIMPGMGSGPTAADPTTPLDTAMTKHRRAVM